MKYFIILPLNAWKMYTNYATQRKSLSLHAESGPSTDGRGRPIPLAMGLTEV